MVEYHEIVFRFVVNVGEFDSKLMFEFDHCFRSVQQDHERFFRRFQNDDERIFELRINVQFLEAK